MNSMDFELENNLTVLLIIVQKISKKMIVHIPAEVGIVAGNCDGKSMSQQ
jgi:hypothetical protein